jgi:hypothetical protein
MVSSKRFARLKDKIFQIIKSSTSIYSDYKKTDIVSQALFGESFLVLKKVGIFFYGINLTDNYNGWISLSDLGKLADFNFYVSQIRTNILSDKDIKSQFIAYLPIRAKVTVISIQKEWVQIDLGKHFSFDIGFIPYSHIIKKNIYKKDWVFFAEKFNETPYRWGGRDSLGIDCSSLIQLSIAFSGYNIPRDTSDQIVYFNDSEFFRVNKYIKGKTKINRGSIVFWTGHIGVAVNKNTIIHASGYHNKVVYENINKAIKRINKEAMIISIKD